MTKKRPTPREMPVGVGFGASHSGMYRATLRLLKDVARAEAEAKEEVAALRTKHNIAAEYRPTPDVELYSAAVQVFAAMTIEASIDLYAVVRFGEDNVRKGFSRGPTWKRLKEFLEAATGAELDDNAEILTAVRNIFAARNAIVHPKSDETRYDDSGRPIQEKPEKFFPGLDGDSARDAVERMNSFYVLIRTADPEAWIMMP
jgi:hypothetical protein